jgi:hypothetical protein
MTSESDYIKAQTALRVELREKNYPCPLCGKPGLSPCGGGNTCWFECKCGGYSALSPTWDAALSNVAGWEKINSKLNARMYPPVGGT